MGLQQNSWARPNLLRRMVLIDVENGNCYAKTKITIGQGKNEIKRKNEDAGWAKWTVVKAIKNNVSSYTNFFCLLSSDSSAAMK